MFCKEEGHLTNKHRVIALLFMSLLLTVLFAMPAWAESYSSKVNSFISDSRWKDGVAWGGGQQPKMPGNHQYWGCAAYACDFTRYVWGADSSYHDAAICYNYNKIRDGDVIATGGHYYVVLQRSGDTLLTAEGNYSSNAACREGRVSMANGTCLLRCRCRSDCHSACAEREFVRIRDNDVIHQPLARLPPSHADAIYMALALIPERTL